MPLPQHLRTAARANHLANRRLAQALAALDAADWSAPRTSFFPSLAATLHHLLAVDQYYIAALHADPEMVAAYRDCAPCADAADWQRRQCASDARLIAWCDALDDAGAQAPVRMQRIGRVDISPAASVLAHLFMHQTHHRGQVHAMLSGNRGGGRRSSMTSWLPSRCRTVRHRRSGRAGLDRGRADRAPTTPSSR